MAVIDLRYMLFAFVLLFTMACGGGSGDSQETSMDTASTSQNDSTNSTDSADSTDSTDNTNSADVAPQKQWFTSHGGSEEESHGHFILACSGGGYLQVGETGYVLETNSSAKLLIVKVDSQGNQQWKTEVGERGENMGNSAIEVADGYLIAGALNRQSALIKVNKNTGDIIFTRTYQKSGTHAVEHIAPVSNGYALVGYTDAEDGTNTFYTEGKGQLFLVDNDGRENPGVATVDLNQYMSHGYRLFEHNGSLLVAGLTAGAEDYAVAKFNQDTLALVWSNTYGGNQPDHLFAMDIDSYGNIYVSGHTLSNTQNWDTLTIKIDNDGNQLWQQVHGNPRGYDPAYIHDEAWGLRVTPDGGAIVAVGTGDEYEAYSSCNTPSTDCSDTWQVYLLKFSASGTLEWQATYGDPQGGDWAGEDIALSTDGGAVVAVDNGGFGFLKLTPF